jgi:hypothetical protein
MLSGPVRSQGRQQARRAQPLAERTGEHARPALLGAPISFGAGRHAPDQVRDMAAHLVGWTSGERPGQVTGQLAAWPPGPQTAPGQPPASA